VVNQPRLYTVDHGLFINAFSTVGDILRSDDTRCVTFLVNMKKFRSKWPWLMSKLDSCFLILLEVLKKLIKTPPLDWVNSSGTESCPSGAQTLMLPLSYSGSEVLILNPDICPLSCLFF